MGEGNAEAWACEFVADWHDRQGRLYRKIADDEPRIDAANRKRAGDVSIHHAGSAAALRNRAANIRRSVAAQRASMASEVEGKVVAWQWRYRCPISGEWHDWTNGKGPAGNGFVSTQERALVPATTLATLQAAILEKDAEIGRLKAVLRAFEGGLVDRPPLARPALTGESDG